ncbi:MAG: type I-C CRISPR-associated protein Cas5c [Granulosicoccus sp.]
MKTHCLEIAGEFACFTRPEMKVERVSYDVITPSAARAVFEAILWKPAIRWHISKIEVLNPVRWINLRRNEVGAVVSGRNVKTAMKKGEGNLGLNIEDERQQRAGLFLRDVKYRIYGHFDLLDRSGGNSPVKFSEMFERRARRGQCFNQPYLGCREFSANFSLIDSNDSSDETSQDASLTRDLGWMLYDLDYSDRANPSPLFFHAQMDNGVIEVPARDSEDVRG